MDTTSLITLLIAALPFVGAGAGGVWLHMRQTQQQAIASANTNAEGRIEEMRTHTTARIRQVEKNAEDRIADLQSSCERERALLEARHTYEVTTLRTELSEARQELRQFNDIMSRATMSLETNASSMDSMVNLMHALLPTMNGEKEKPSQT